MAKLVNAVMITKANVLLYSKQVLFNVFLIYKSLIIYSLIVNRLFLAYYWTFFFETHRYIENIDFAYAKL